jgi:hypothetical protein
MVPKGYIAKYRGHNVKELDVNDYFVKKDKYDEDEELVYLLTSKVDLQRVLVLRGRPIGHLDEADQLHYAKSVALDDYYPLQMKIYREAKMQQRLKEDNATQWILKEMERISPKDYKGTYYTCAEMQFDKPGRIIRVILPVDEYEVGNMGYEIMPVAQLAKYCPWDMMRTLVTIHSKHTNIDYENLHDLVLEDAEVHKHLSALEGGK